MAKGLPCEPGKASRDAYREWLYDQQDGLCYLGIHPACRRAERQMHLTQINSKGSFATFDHVVARSRVPGTTLILLACWRCNNRKGSDEPKPEHVEYAKKLRQLWFNRNKWPPPKHTGAYRQLEIEAEQRACRAALGLNPGRKTSKYLSNLRKATGLMGR